MASGAGQAAAPEHEDAFADRHFTQTAPADSSSSSSDESDQATNRPCWRKKPDQEDSDEDYQPDPQRGQRRKRQPELDANGQPIKKARSQALYESGQPKRHRTKPKYDENGQVIKQTRRTEATGADAGDKNCWADPNQMMVSTEGEQMTRGELGRRFKTSERRYRPGGIWGGKYEILATGVIWTFVPDPEKLAQRKAKSGSSGGEQSSQETNNKNNSQQSVSTQGSQRGKHNTSSAAVPGGRVSLDDGDTTITNSSIYGLREEHSPTAASSSLSQPQLSRSTSTTSGPSGQQARRTSIHRPNAPTHVPLPPRPALPPAPTAPLTPRPARTTIPTLPVTPPQQILTQAATPPTPKPRRILIVPPRRRYDPSAPVAVRVRQLDDRCGLHRLSRRDRFESDEQFLAYAEGQMDVLWGSGDGRGRR